MTARIALGICYDGSAYHGWQVQKELRTVQGEVERALSAVADHTISVFCAGRTDVGVHANGQVVHFDTTSYRSGHSWVFGTNSHLPFDISILWAKEVDKHFHARFSAQARRYRYMIYNHKIRPSLLCKAVSWYYQPLDENQMRIAAQYFIGEHDFRSFQGAGCQSQTSVRTIFLIKIFRIQCMVIIEVQGNAFLLHMVRNIVGVLIAIGSGKKKPEWAEIILKTKDYHKRGMTAPSNGLYLVEVTYSREFSLPKTPAGPLPIIN